MTMPTQTTNSILPLDMPVAAPMKAYLVKKYKSPMKAGEVAEPTVGDRDVLVDIHAAGVNLLDAKIRDGEFKLILPYKAPLRPRARPRRRGDSRRVRRDALQRG